MNNKEITLFLDAWLTGDVSAAIEKSEKREQQIAVKNQRLPIKTNDMSIPHEIRFMGITDEMDYNQRFDITFENNKNWTARQYEKMGIKVIGEHDDLFLNVVLPKGWEIKATDHSMWNDVIDNKGRKRISFFYKGSFYDRESFSDFKTRYTYSVVPFDEYQTDASYEERKLKEWYGIINDCGKEIYRTNGYIKKGYFDDTLEKECKKYLELNYPEWEDINAYWD